MQTIFEHICRELSLGCLTGEPRQLSGGYTHRMYALPTGQGLFAVKLLNPEIMQRPDAPGNYRRAEAFERLLEEAGLPILPALTIGGRKLHCVDGQYLYLFPHYAGHVLTDREITPEHCRRMGGVLARIHACADRERPEEEDAPPAPIDWAKLADTLLACPAARAEGERLQQALPMLTALTESAISAARRLPRRETLCHNDMDPKNVLWQGDDFRIIDLECLGYANPQQELLDLAVTWAGTEGQEARFKAFVKGYYAAGGSPVTDAEVCCDSRRNDLDWLRYCVQRALSPDPQERRTGREQIAPTLDRLEDRLHSRECILRWLRETEVYGLQLIHYCHPDCEPLKNIMRLPEEEAFRLAADMARKHPDASAFFRFSDFDSYYPRRMEADGILSAAFRDRGGRPAQAHPLSFALEGSDFLDGWFDRGTVLRLPLACVPEDRISFTLGDSLGMLDRTGGFIFLTLPELLSRIRAHPEGATGFLRDMKQQYRYIEAQLWDDAPCRHARTLRSAEKSPPAMKPDPPFAHYMGEGRAKTMPDTILTEASGPLFYFFLRKTGDASAAEDLASDVLLAFLAACRAGRELAHPRAWIWQVARNRYAAWARDRRIRLEQEVCGDDATAAADDADMTAGLLQREDAARLRRELAFIRREYREVVVAHYIEDRSVADIARRLSLPEGTVKTRLRRCRSKIREGMDMAREFGPRSYNPENMDFVTSGNMPSSLPNSAMARKLPLNILLEASENPSTVEELAMALGVAVPYMEEEVRLLADATLLRQSGDRYVTAFYIMDGETASRLRRTLRENAAGRTKAVRAIALDMLPLLRQLHPDNARRTDNDLLWWLLPHVHETAMFSDPHYVCDFPERSCGRNETWGVEGFERVEDPDWERCLMGRCLNQQDNTASGLYQYDHECEAMWNRAGIMNGRQAALLGSLLRQNRPLSALTDTEKGVWQTLCGRFAHEQDGHAVSDVVVLPREGLQKLERAIRAHPCYAALENAVKADFDRLLRVFSAIPGAILREQKNYAASNEICNSRMMVLNDCLADGTLTLPAQPESSTAGMWIELR